ncbi:MAG TPA: hypothetical protein VMQ10_08030, partial [Spirochaetia bacterium]|nr:hypothetical protein [Spirochaetia bacterium]
MRMDNVNRLIAWILAQCFLLSSILAPLPLVAQGQRIRPVPAAPVAACAEASAEGLRASRLVGPADPAVLELDGVRLEVPAGAVERPTRLSITRLAVVPELGEGMTNVTGAAGGFRFEPHGAQFRKPVRLTMAYDPREAQSETARSNLFIYFHDDTAGRWERLERVQVDARAATVTCLSRHFTDMINATLRLPEGPQPIQYDVSSIKNLEAASPAEGVPLPQGPQPGPFGAASFSIPLRLPPGRGA